MEIIKQFGWVYYLGDKAKNLNKHKRGKWMHFFNNREFIEKICKQAVEECVVEESKHTDDEEGVSCFYLEYNDIGAHKRTIKFFLDNDLIRRTKKGKLYNISFKLDDQTRAGEYGSDFQSEIKLEQFLNLETGDWKV